MTTGLLLLRLGLATLIFGHGAQKLFGWFGGLGPVGTGVIFEKWGLRPGTRLVRLAATCELTSSVVLALGLLTPFGAAVAMGTLAVACSVVAPNGLWAQKGGYELPLVYAGIAAVIAFTGPGRWSLDHAVGLTSLAGNRWGVAVVIVGFVSAAALSAYARRNRRRHEDALQTGAGSPTS